MNNYSNYRNYYTLNQNPMEGNQNTMDSGVSRSLNYNMCDYDQQNVTPNTLYDPYQGFIHGNMFPDLYDSYKGRKPYHVEPVNEQARLLTEIDALQFASHDLNLFLDTHPNDRDMIHLFHQYQEETNRLTKEYERQYGPLYVFSTPVQTPWAWNQSPWPWEYM